MSLEEKIYQDYVSAMKQRDQARVDFLSFIRADIKNAAITAKKDKLEDNETLSVLKKQRKRLQDSRESFVASGRAESVAQLDAEIAMIEQYLPSQMSDEELTAVVAEVISASGASSIKDMGRVMKEVMAKVGARADNAKVSAIVKSKLA